MVNRKLIRPNLAQVKERFSAPRAHGGTETAPRETPANGSGSFPKRRPAPPDHTNAEAFYYLKQMNGKTPMVVLLEDGEKLVGHIEWYDRGCIKVHREGAPNVLLFKHSIKYLYKAEEDDA